MSRIHEALKRAEQERASDPPGMVAEKPIEQLALTAAIADNPLPKPVLPPSIVVQGNSGTAAEIARPDEVRENCAQPRWNMDTNLVLFQDAVSPLPGTEQFRTLRSRLYRIREKQTLRTILITSTVPAEGKTFVAVNLAQAIARQQDRRVLLIDADMRAPRVHTLLGAPSGPGLADYLQGEVSELETIQRGPNECLCLIPAGKHVAHPAELISNGRLKRLLERVTPLFDWVIIDSPPALPVADPSVLAHLCDGVLLVVRAGITPAAIIQRTCKELLGRNVLGVVLNAVDKKTGAYDSYSYYAGEGYGHKEPATSRK